MRGGLAVQQVRSFHPRSPRPPHVPPCPTPTSARHVTRRVRYAMHASQIGIASSPLWDVEWSAERGCKGRALSGGAAWAGRRRRWRTTSLGWRSMSSFSASTRQVPLSAFPCWWLWLSVLMVLVVLVLVLAVVVVGGSAGAGADADAGAGADADADAGAGAGADADAGAGGG
eukprot:692426-Rhodomonas_salina.3